MKFFDKWKNQKWVPYTIASCSAVLLYVILTNISFFGKGLSSFFSVVKPVFTGIVLAYIMDPLARYINKRFFSDFKNKSSARKISIVLDIVIIIVVVVLLFLALVPQLIESIFGFIENNAQYASNIENSFDIINNTLFNGQMNAELFATMIETILEKLATFVSSHSGNIISTSQKLGSSLVNLVVGFILAIYFMFSKESLLEFEKKVLHAMLKEDHYDQFVNFCYRCDKILIRYIECDLIEGFIVGMCNALFMLTFKMPYVALISVVVGITNLAPTFGPIVGCFIGSFVLVLIKPSYAMLFIIFTLVLQTVDGYIIKPKLFGSTLGVSSLLILITIVIGGNLFGVVGILIAIPFAAIAQYVVVEILSPQEHILIKNEKKD